MPHLNRRRLLLLLAAGAAASAQQPATTPEAPQDALPTLKLQTRVVAVSAIVRDKHGLPIPNLTAADFTLKEDGQPQPIRYLSSGSELPLTLALMVDTSGSQRRFIADETAASQVFFRAMLTRPEDRAVLVQFDTDVLRLQGMTNSVDKLTAALGHLSEPHDAASGSHGGTLLYDAIYATSRSLLQNEKGRRAMVLLTDGGDNGSRITLDQAVSAALRQDVAIYSVFYSDVDSGDSHFGKRVLEALSSSTGGRVFVVSKKLSLEAIYARIAEDMRLQYQIGYTPPPSSPGTFHRIELTTRDKHATVAARKGYFTLRDATP